MQLHDALRQLATARTNVALTKEMVSQAGEILHATPEWAAFEKASAGLATASAAEADAYAQAREVALETFRTTGDKNPAQGVAIKMYKHVRYEVAEALSWCKTHAPVFVKEVLDARAFEKAVEQMVMTDAPWRIEYEGKPIIATDLSTYLAEEEDEDEDEDDSSMTDDRPDGTMGGCAGGIHDPLEFDLVPPESALDHQTRMADSALETEREAAAAFTAGEIGPIEP